MVTVELPDIENEVMRALKAQLLQQLMEVAAQVSQIVRDAANLENEDVNGNQMPNKIPRPKRNPTNFPNWPLVQTGNMMDGERWSVEQTGEVEVSVCYDAPEYLQYLADKGREWITANAINPNARAKIDQLIADTMGGTQ